MSIQLIDYKQIDAAHEAFTERKPITILGREYFIQEIKTDIFGPPSMFGGTGSKIEVIPVLDNRPLDMPTTSATTSALQSPDETPRERQRREIATALFAAMVAQPGSTVDIDGARLGQKRAQTAIALADTLLAELAKGG